MAFNVAAAKLTGSPDPSSWTQIHDFVPEEAQKLKLRGRLFAVITTQRRESGIDSVAAGRELLSRLHEEYFGTTEASAFEALKASVEKVIKEATFSWDNVEVAAVSLLEDVVYSVAAGGAQVAIFREGMLAKILVSQEVPISASGYPRDEDILLAATKEFFNSFPQGVIKAALESKGLETAVEALAPTVISRQDKGSLGAIFLKFEKQGLPERIVVSSIPAGLRIPEAATRIVRFTHQASQNIFSRFFRKLPERKVYVHEAPEEKGLVGQHKKLSVSVGIILLALLSVSIFFGIREKSRLDQKARYGPVIASARHEYEEAVGLISLNPQRARELFVQSRNEVEGLLSQKVLDPDLAELKRQMDENTGKILGEYEVIPELFIDLSLLSSGFEGDAIAASSESLFVLDSKGKKVIKIALDTKRSEVAAGPNQIEEAQGLAAYSDRVFILNTKGVFEVGRDFKKALEADWKGEALVYAYAGNLYVLDKESSSIWRYLATTAGFGTKQSWFAPGVSLNLSKVIVWSIDGSIWLLTDTGEIIKFASGNPQTFNPSGVFPELARPKSIYTSENAESLYILEKDAGRVVVLKKGGEYQAQYISDKIKEAKGLVVSEKEKKIILLTGTTLYSIELKHFE